MSSRLTPKGRPRKAPMQPQSLKRSKSNSSHSRSGSKSGAD